MGGIIEILLTVLGFIGLSYLITHNQTQAIGLGIILYLFWIKLVHIANK